MHRLLIAAVAFATLAAPLHAATSPSPPTMVPFVIPWDDAAPGGATDMSFLNAKPAGVNGPIVVRNGHFVEANTGARIRFMGVNITFGASFPEHADAEKIAAHLAKLGVNIVRIHHHDINHSVLWDKTAKGHSKFDPVAIDKLDYLLAQLKKNGIYVDLNLHVSRTFVPDDGFPDSVSKIQSEFDKRIDNVDLHMIELQKKFAHDYLTRVNPYTGMSYVDDPAVAMIEVNNENDLAWQGRTSVGFCDSLPEPFRGEIVKDWNEWLSLKYKSSADVATAWYKVAPTAAPPAEILNAKSEWKFEDQSKVGGLIPVGDIRQSGPPDVAVSNGVAATAAWHTQAHVIGLDLQEGVLYTLAFRAKASSPRRLPVYVSMDEPDWHHLGLDAKPLIGTDWANYRYTFQVIHPTPGHSRLSFMFGADPGVVLLSNVTLSTGSPASAFGPGSNLESHSIDIPVSGTVTSLADWMHFIVDTETAYADDMRAYIRTDLKAHANVIDTQMSYGGTAGFRREAGSDFADSHAYWQQPEFPGRAWDQANWTLKNIPMTDALASGDGGVFGPLAAYRVAGKPYSISEYNHPAPSDYQAEMYPEIASYAAYQDWDAIFEFDYGGYSPDKKPNGIQGFFALQGNPDKEAFLPGAALLFRTGVMKPSSKVLTLHLPVANQYDAGTAADAWTLANGGPLALLSQRFQTVIDDKANSPVITSSTNGTADSSVKAITTPQGSVYLAQCPSAVTAAGFVGGQTLDIGSVHVALPSFGNNFAGVTLVADDMLPLTQSRKLLLTLSGKAENVGVKWNADRTSVGLNWGRGGAQAEGIPATITLDNASVKSVWALDPTGARTKSVPVSTSGGKAIFTVGPEYGTVWYEIGG